MKKPRKWIDVYPQGSKAGDEEQAFFISLARSKWAWRSVAHLAKETNLSKERIEQIINKYLKYKPPMIYQNPANEDMWGYWARLEADGINISKDEDSLTAKDHKDRIQASP